MEPGEEGWDFWAFRQTVHDFSRSGETVQDPERD